MKIKIRNKGDCLIPDGHLNHKFLQKMKKQSGIYYFEALYQGNPSSKGSGLFEEEYFKYWKELPKNIKYKLISIDCAEETKSESDFSCLQYWIESDKGYYLIDQLRGKWKFPLLEKNTKLFCEKHRTNKILIEAKSNGTALYQNLKQNTKLPLEAIKPIMNKEIRVSQIIGQIETGNVYFPDSAIWMYDFIKELSDFPTGKHDDQVDPLSQALNYLIFKRKIIRVRNL